MHECTLKVFRRGKCFDRGWSQSSSLRHIASQSWLGALLVGLAVLQRGHGAGRRCAGRGCAGARRLRALGRARGATGAAAGRAATGSPPPGRSLTHIRVILMVAVVPSSATASSAGESGFCRAEAFASEPEQARRFVASEARDPPFPVELERALATSSRPSICIGTATDKRSARKLASSMPTLTPRRSR